MGWHKSSNPWQGSLAKISLQDADSTTHRKTVTWNLITASTDIDWDSSQIFDK